jgi:hypothetical protein
MATESLATAGHCNDVQASNGDGTSSLTLPPPPPAPRPKGPFYHDEKRELLICIRCGEVLPSSDRLELLKHLTTVHKDTTETFEKEHKLDMDLVLDEVSKIKILKLTKEDRIRLASMGRVPYLPVQDGFKCNIPDCAGQYGYPGPFAAGKEGSILTHKKNFHRGDKRKDWSKATKVQQLSRHPGNYFAIPGDGACKKGSNEGWLQPYRQFEADIQKQQLVAERGRTFRENTAWSKRNRFHETCEGLDMGEARDLCDPKKKTTDLLRWDWVMETVGVVLDLRLHESLKKMRLDEHLLRLFYSTDPNKISGKPFYFVEEPSKPTYFNTWKQMFAFFLRTFQGHEGSYGMRYTLLPEEQVCLRNIEEMASVNGDDNPETTERLEDQIIELSDHFIRHPCALRSTRTPIAFFIAVLAFNKKTGVWYSGLDTRPILSRLVYCGSSSSAALSIWSSVGNNGVRRRSGEWHRCKRSRNKPCTRTRSIASPISKVCGPGARQTPMSPICPW